MEATKLIRSYEKQHALPRTPIIALTVHTITVIDDHLQAGMDDHIKPLSRTCRA
ncbi:hypothetical protein M378DRAFT_659752 [Amanita muscaria Koide BX008]|uniref:Uncharacterized protein n=1 Tax=Amanita muscaria (strain Koide BX008) TaxID=946122 RepID=A0A0C2X4H0_AMAMK|nr:hypothetical protein M378DRAFT_659752 [Amanita muscaria Koide BX008]